MGTYSIYKSYFYYKQRQLKSSRLVNLIDCRIRVAIVHPTTIINLAQFILFLSLQKVSSNHRCSPVKTSSSTPDLNRSKYKI